MYKIDIDALEREKAAVISFYKRQVEAFRDIKKAAEKVQWADERYDEFVISMNSIGSALVAVLQTISNGDDVYAISQLLLAAEEYLQFEKKFPLI